MTSVTRTRRGDTAMGAASTAKGSRGVARLKAARRIGRRGHKPQRALARSEITSGEGFGFRNRPS